MATLDVYTQSAAEFWAIDTLFGTPRDVETDNGKWVFSYDADMYGRHVIMRVHVNIPPGPPPPSPPAQPVPGDTLGAIDITDETERRSPACPGFR